MIKTTEEDVSILEDALALLEFGDSAEEKHLAGRHNQKDHGRLGAGISAEDYGVQAQFADAMEPNTIPSGTQIIGFRFGANVSGLATGRSVKGRSQVERAIRKLEMVYPDTKYFFHLQNDRYNIIQVGDGPIKATVTKEFRAPVPPKEKKDVVEPEPAVAMTRKLLFERYGIKPRTTKYGKDAEKLIAFGEKMFIAASEFAVVSIPQLDGRTEQAMIDAGLIGPRGNKLTVSQDLNQTKYPYALTLNEAMKVHQQMLSAVPNPYGFATDRVRDAIADGLAKYALPTTYRYREDIDENKNAVRENQFFDVLAQSHNRVGMLEGKAWLEKNLLSDEPAPPITLKTDPKDLRAAASKQLGLLMTKSDDGGTLVHERGHWLEYYDDELGTAAQQFIKARAKTVKHIKLKTLTGASYEKWEKALKDKFINPYVGKIYGGKNESEVYSMGLEQMFHSPENFIHSDPDHYFLTLAAMYGKKYRP